MIRSAYRLTLVMLAALTSTTFAQLPPDQAAKSFQVTDGLAMTLWAAEPMLINPTSMDVDALGRVWVCEAVNYRQILRGKSILRPEGDRILILSDSKGTGQADTLTVFAQSPEVQAPLGICVLKLPVGPGYRVYVCQSPNILVFDDLNGDGKADGPPRKLLTGFGGVDHDHGVHGITIGPDGRLLFSVGDQGVKNLVDRNGKSWTSNGTDCRAGTIWRCDLDGKNLELIAHNFRNEYKPCVDSFGNLFVSDNDDDGNQQTRICHVIPGGNYGYHPRGPGQSHWHEEQPGVMPKILRTYFGSPTGLCVYEGSLLPESFRGQLIHADAGPRHIRRYRLSPQGASYDVERTDIVESSDNWFRPSDVCVAPDGSVMVADWYDPGVGGHGMGDTTRGRIYRLSPKDAKVVPVKLDLESYGGLVDALASPALSVRALALETIKSLPRERAKAVVKLAVARPERYVQARAAYLWAMLDEPADELPTPAGDDFAEQRVRIATDFHKPMKPLKRDDYGKLSPAVRRELLLRLRDVPAAEAREPILRLAQLYPGNDRFYLASIGIAVGTDTARRETILAGFDEAFPTWNDATADLIWELRPPTVLPRLEAKLNDPQTPSNQKGRIAEILATSDTLAAGRLLLQRADAEADPAVRAKLLAAVIPFLPGKWRELAKDSAAKELVDRWLNDPIKQRDGLTLVSAMNLSGRANRVREIVTQASDLTIKHSALQTLGSFADEASVQALVAFARAHPAEARIALDALTPALDSRKPTPGQAAALKSLQNIMLDVDSPPELAKAALNVLAGSRPGTTWLLATHDKGQLPTALAVETGRLVRSSAFPDLRNKALIAFPTTAKLDISKLPPLAEMAQRHGDAERGRKLFQASTNSEMQCMKCHRVAGQGGQIGPDLSAIGKKASRENLLESILIPSKAIADQFINWQIVTDKGVTLTGLVVEETPQALTIRDANGKDTRIPLSEIDTRSKSLVSLMPEGLMNTFTEAELLDVMEYLTTLMSDTKAP